MARSLIRATCTGASVKEPKRSTDVSESRIVSIQFLEARSIARRFFRRQYEHGREERPSVLGAGGEWNEVVPRKFAMSAAIQRLGRRPGNLMRHRAVGDGRPE